MQNKKIISSSEGRKTFTVILSIVIALFLWAYVIGEVNPTIRQTIPDVPVQLLNVQSLEARELAVAGNTGYTVDVVVEGKRSDIVNMNPQEILAEADLFGWSKGENFVPVNVKVPDTLNILEVKAAKIQVNIEDLVALSRPVVVVYSGLMPENTEAGGVEIKPAEIEVTGAKSDVDAVVSVQATIDIAMLSDGSSTVQAEAVPVNYAGMPVDSVKLSAGYVDVSAKLYSLKEVPLLVDFIGELGSGYGLETRVPETVKIKGSKNALKEIESVSAEPVDISGITTAGNANLVLVLPEGVEPANGYEILKAEFTAVEVSSKSFEFSSEEILIQGLTEGGSADMDPATLEVTLVGRKEVMNTLARNQIRLSVDVTDLPTGSHVLKVSATYSGEGIHKATIIPEEITLNLINID